MSTKPKCLIDLGGVVFEGTGRSNQPVNWPIISALNDELGHALNIGEDVFPQFIQRYNSKTQQNLSGKAFLELVWMTLEFNQQLIEMLRKRYDLIIVSDNYRENIDFIRSRFNFDTWAIDQHYSFDYALEKSDPEFFKQFLTRTKLDPKELIFIDDSQKKLNAAATCGIKGYLFEGNDILGARLHL